MTKFYVYKHTNIVNGKIYIGKSNNPVLRWARHIYDSKKERNESKLLLFHRAIRKYGAANFIMEILSEYSTNQEALIGEKYFIKEFQSNDLNIGYNLTSGGEGVAGYHRTLEQKLAISERNSGSKNGMYGKPQSFAARIERGKKISETKKVNPASIPKVTLETIEKLKKAVKEKSSQTLSDAQKDLIVNLYNSGNFLKRELAKQFCVEEKTIKYIIRYWIDVKNNKSKKITNEQSKNIIDLYMSKKYTRQQISEVLSISLNRIHNIIKKYRKSQNNKDA